MQLERWSPEVMQSAKPHTSPTLLSSSSQGRIFSGRIFSLTLEPHQAAYSRPKVTPLRRWWNSIKKIKNGKKRKSSVETSLKSWKKTFSQSILKKTDYKLFKLLCAQFVASLIGRRGGLWQFDSIRNAFYLNVSKPWHPHNCLSAEAQAGSSLMRQFGACFRNDLLTFTRKTSSKLFQIVRNCLGLACKSWVVSCLIVGF